MTSDFVTISRRAALAGTAAALLTARAARAEKKAIVFGSTNATSSNYALAVAMTKAIKQDLPEVNVTMIETGASVDNIRRMMKDEIDFGLVMADTIIQATEGVGPFKGRVVNDLGVLYVHDAASLQFAARGDAGVNDLKDLQGKRFSAGIHGSGAELLTREIMRVLSIEPKWSPGSLQDAIEGTQNRQLVGYSKYGVGVGLDATMRELLTTTPMKFLGFTDAQRDLVLSKIKGVDFVTIPANTVPGQAAVSTPEVLATYSARMSQMDDATAYAIARAIYDHRQYLIDVFPHLKNFDFKANALKTEKLGLRLHPGAKKFWESVTA